MGKFTEFFKGKVKGIEDNGTTTYVVNDFYFEVGVVEEYKTEEYCLIISDNKLIADFDENSYEEFLNWIFYANLLSFSLL